MRETAEELSELENLLDTSLARSTDQLRSIVVGRTLTAEQLCQLMTGITRTGRLSMRPTSPH